LLAGATPGVHCTHSEYYYRTVRVAAGDATVPMILKAGFRVEVSVIDNNKVSKLGIDPVDGVINVTLEILPTLISAAATLVVYFAIKEKNYTKSKYDISLWEQLYLVRELQNLWSDNSVSCTITFAPEEEKDLASGIKFVAPYVKTLSFLPLDNHSYAQAPYQIISEKEYTEYTSKLKTLKLKSKSDSVGEKYCNNDTCIVT
jgi:ribonucleoside-diphosphate reductase alpha chain/ribonucleoside-triphosphate reductase